MESRHLLDLCIQNALDCISENFNRKNFHRGACTRNSLEKCAVCSPDGSLHSKRFHASSSRKLGQEQKKKGMRGEGEGSEGNAARKPHDFEKLRSPTNAAFDWCGAGSVD